MEISNSQKIIADTTAKVSAISAIPIPYLDVAAMTYFQYNMVKRLANEHLIIVDSSRSLILSSFISSVVSKMITSGIENLVSKAKAETMLKDSLIRASVSGFITTVIGEVYLIHFQNGGTLDDISLNSFAGYFESQIKDDKWSLTGLSDDLFDSMKNLGSGS